MSQTTVRRILSLAVTLCIAVTFACGAEEFDYAAADAELKVVRLDSSATESFLSIRADTQGRLFVGGREALFVYEPDGRGGYGPRQELVRFPAHSWVNDIAIRGRDVYVTTVTALYVIPDAVVKRKNLKPRRLVWGVPRGHTHQCLHGLAWGPEGDLYFSMGDPRPSYGDFSRPDHWAHWTFFTQPEGTKVPYTGVGGVFRCRSDGSEFQVVAGGLRNACGLVFDEHWNLFSNDNDHESMPADYVPGRLIHVTPHADFSWPRGWMVEKTPRRADLLASMITTMGRSVPVGQSYYNETFLPGRYRDNLLVARWGIRSVTRYPLKNSGASFKTGEHRLLVGQNRARPVGVGVGRGGRIFAAIAYMPHNDGSPTYESDLVMITRADDGADHPFEPYDALSASDEKLYGELANPSWQPRYRAHVELCRRGKTTVAKAIGRLQTARGDDRATPHLIWLAGVAAKTVAAQQRSTIRDLLVKYGKETDPQLRLQAVRALTEFFAGDDEATAVFTGALRDANLQVRHAGVVAFFEVSGAWPKGLIVRAATEDDTYLRQAAAFLIAQRATLAELKQLSATADPKGRLAGVLAAGFRLTIPAATKPIGDLPLTPFPGEEPYDIPYFDERIDLRKLARIGQFTVAEHWKAAKHSEEQQALFALLRDRFDDDDEQVRMQAIHFLHLLGDPRTEPEIARILRQDERRRLAKARITRIGTVWLTGPFPDGDESFKRVHPPEQQAVDLSSAYAAGSEKRTWQQATARRLFNFTELFGRQDHSSCYVYCRLHTARRRQAILLVGSDDGVKVWQNGREISTNDVVRGALPFEDVIYLDLEPGSNDILIRVHNDTGESGLYLHYRALGDVVATVPEKVGVETLAQRLKAAAADPQTAEQLTAFLDIDWMKAVKQGDRERGRKLFSADGLACAKCHAQKPGEEVIGGPSLTGAGKRFTVNYLVQSMLIPNRQVSPVFRATLIETTGGEAFSGLIVGETGEKIELLLSDAKRRTINKADIATRKLQNVSPMPGGLIKKPEELRDILAFLLGG